MGIAEASIQADVEHVNRGSLHHEEERYVPFPVPKNN